MDRSDIYEKLMAGAQDALSLMEDAGVGYLPLGVRTGLEILFEKASQCYCHNAGAHPAPPLASLWGSGFQASELAFVLDTYPDDTDGPEKELLSNMIKAMGLHPADVYITSAVKCRLAGSAEQERVALLSCAFLARELGLVSPTVVVALGPLATLALIDSPLRLSSLRGRFQRPRQGLNKGSFRIMPTHPLPETINNKGKKAYVWKDLQAVISALKL